MKINHFRKGNKNEQDCLSIEGKSPVNVIRKHAFCSCDLDLDPMTLM